MEQQWTLDELEEALLNDDLWEVPKEEREFYLMDLAWNLLMA